MSKLDLASLRFDGLIGREWLASNGVGGFASSTLSSLNTRKYHGLLVAAMMPPVRRMVLLSRVEEMVRCEGRSFDLASNEYPGTIHPQGHSLLRAFSHEPFPRWGYQGEGWTIEKQLRMVQGENTVVLSYVLLGGDTSVELEVRPLFALRGIHELMYQWNANLDAVELEKQHHRIPATSRSPEVFFAHDGAFAPQSSWYLNTIYRREQQRGYAGLEDLWMPGVVKWKLNPGQSVHFVCSAEPIDFLRTLAEAQRQYESAVPPLLINRKDEDLETMLRAAEQFVVRKHDDGPMVMGSYPWAAPSGRDALISMTGLMLVPGKIKEAGEMLSWFAANVKEGVMPSDLPEDGSAPRYNGADVSLWFVHAVNEYLRYRGDEALVQRMLPVIDQIIDAYRRGTELGIGTDGDGLLHTEAPGQPTTWMDAKVGDWIITPRRGRPVSINALWYNALRIAADLSSKFGQSKRSNELLSLALRVKDSFNERFWNAAANCCFDVVREVPEMNDPAIRPNQLFAISLPYAVLESSRHAAVLEIVRVELLTKFGLRTLTSEDEHYQGHYAGPPVARDRAYHQGSVYPWLLGAYVSAYVKVAGRTDNTRREARKILDGCLEYMQGDGIGQLCELFDGDAPHKPGGAIASARSVAEVLRAYVEDVLEVAPVNDVQPIKPRPAGSPVVPGTV